MKRGTLIACILVVVLLAGGIAVLTFWPEAQPEIESEEPLIQSPENRGDLISEANEDVLEVTFTPQDGVPFTIRRYESDEDGEGFELVATDAIFDGDISAMRSVFGAATSLTNLTLVTENADDEQLAIFGLDAPVMIWEISLADGGTVELMVGEVQLIGDGRYVRLADSREVFLLNQRQTVLLTHSMDELYDLSFFPLPPATPDMPTWMAIEHVYLELADDVVIEVRQRTEEELMELDHLMMPSHFVMLQPYEGETNQHVVQTLLLEAITNLIPTSVVEERPADLSVFGLDEPTRLTVAIEDWSATLLIGARSAELGGQYVMLEGYDAVLLDVWGNYSFLNVDPAHILNRLIWIHAIVDVDYVTFELEGETRVLRFEHDFEEDNLEGWLDDVQLSETNARRLYIGVLSIMQDSSTDADIPNILPAYRITIQLLDGSSDTVELYQIDDAQFLIVRNGENTGFFLTRMSLQQNFLSRLEIVDAGGMIP